jgi:hypothetical protein
MGGAALMVPEYVAATTAAEAVAPAVASSLLAESAAPMLAETLPGSIESAGLLEMSPGNFINPDYFVGEGLGMPMFTGAPNAPFLEKAGNFLGSMGDAFQQGGMKMNPMNTMKMFGQPQGSKRPMAQAGPRLKAQNVPPNPVIYNQNTTGGIQLTEQQKEELRRRYGLA